eukprot:TRINITY_DN5309_c0_g1_i1.p2 TRINITY_DN5309_c0_g1~~TRINITY_DN5309_c0_g1_i1.p2  ORF type:complete len:201 (-),score=37.12 TRINITY_DN5309_c0_g1_i1:28-630(-)
MRSWYRRNPEFALEYVDSAGQPAGMFIAIPLSPAGWRRLAAGEVSEAQAGLVDADVFDRSRDAAIGFHFYHIESSGPGTQGFADRGLRDLGALVRQLGTAVCGVSNLSVSKAGVGLSLLRWDMRESIASHGQTEHILQRSDGSLVVKVGLQQDELTRLITADGLRYVVRCRLLVLLPTDVSLVWVHLPRVAHPTAALARL